MLARATTHALVGLTARTVEVEAHLQGGVPGFQVVGLPDKACQEARERVRSAIASAELEWPRRRITVNLAPARLRKEGSGFDLPIALAVLAASRQIPPERLGEHAALGELALDGRIRPVPGALVAAEAARATGLPFWASFVLGPEGQVLSGEPLADVAAKLRAAGAEAVLVNCFPPDAVEPALRALSDGGPTGALPHLGKFDPPSWKFEFFPRFSQTEEWRPERVAGLAGDWLRAGARIIGTCCGSGPGHTRALVQLLGVIV